MRRLVRVSVLGVVLILAAAAGIFGLSLRTPTGFLPEEDQGAFFVSVQLPDGASVGRTSDAVRRIETLLKQMPQVQNVFSVIGRSIIDSVNEPNAAFIVPILKPFADRAGAANSAQALIARVFAEGQQVRTATVIPFNLPPIIGLSTTGGFEYELEGLEGQDPVAMNSVMQALLSLTRRRVRPKQTPRETVSELAIGWVSSPRDLRAVRLSGTMREDRIRLRRMQRRSKPTPRFDCCGTLRIGKSRN